MQPLNDQTQFEALWFDTAHPENGWIVYFTAAWCSACKRLDTDAIAAAAVARGIPIYKCDYTVNDYTPGYCQVTAFPTFTYFKPRKVVSSERSSVTDDVLGWVQSL